MNEITKKLLKSIRFCLTDVPIMVCGTITALLMYFSLCFIAYIINVGLIQNKELTNENFIATIKGYQFYLGGILLLILGGIILIIISIIGTLHKLCITKIDTYLNNDKDHPNVSNESQLQYNALA